MSQVTRQTDPRSFLSHKSCTLAAGKDTKFAVTGNVFICSAAAKRFMMRWDEHPEIPMETGLGFRLAEGDFFSEITIRNSSAETQTIEFYAGSAQVLDARLNTMLDRYIAVYQRDFPTKATWSYDGNLAAGGTLQFPAYNPVMGTQRRALVVSNGAAAGGGYLLICDTDEHPLCRVFPLQTVVFESSDNLIVKNPTGAAIACTASEIHYTT